MPVTRKIGSAPLVMPSEAAAIAAAAASASTTKAGGAPSSSHVRIQRGAGTERAIQPAAPMALAVKP